ncbi:phosphate ABC transporter substrate-binding protein PstS [Lysobacter korlensis]|uniref:Phosphate-binding protein PstS n=1 Tax=Lysobacter korlensis TaxID=553636 RepID=A0ABV6RWP0_9GAMM
MNIKRYGSVAAVALAGTIVLSSCAANEAPANTGTDSTNGGGAPASELEGNLSGIGSSAVGAAQEAWIAEFQDKNPGVTINYAAEGSGAGREAFLAGAANANFAGSDRAFNDEEVAAGGWGACASDEIVELPLYISPIAVVFNLEGIETLNMDAATIAGIFNGDITTWDDEAIASQNEDADLPDTAITPVHRSDDSGTTENFTDYLFQAAPDVWTHEPDGLWPIEGGEAADGTSGVIDAVSNASGTIAYADASRAGDLGTVAVEINGEYLEFSPEAAAAIVDASPRAEGRSAGDLAYELDRTPDEAAYPIALVAYLIGCQDYSDDAVGELVKAYFSYMASEEGQQTAAESAGSAPISDAVRTEVESAIESIS